MSKKQLAEQEVHLSSRLSVDPVVESRIWTNRLDRVLQDRLSELKNGLNKIVVNLERVEASLDDSSDGLRLVQELSEYTGSLYRNIYPDLVEMYVRAADSSFELDSQVLELRAKLDLAEKQVAHLNNVVQFAVSSRGYRFGRLVGNLYRRVFAKPIVVAESKEASLTENTDAEFSPTRIPTPPLEGRFPYRELAEQDTSLGFSNYENVDNSDTPLEVFENWKTVYHWQGRRLGSKAPILSDHLGHLIELNKVLSFRNKTVLELGPFEGANTKEFVDLGAKSVVAIEANREFFLKCLVLQNYFGWENVELIYGDCNRILGAPEFRQRMWFDICYASGILYHMKDPLHFIDLITQTAPTIYVWSQYASADAPLGPWTELRDGEDRLYEARWNDYEKIDHWGGVASGAFWLTKDSMLAAFRDRGFSSHFVKLETNNIGNVISFVAQRDDVAMQ